MKPRLAAVVGLVLMIEHLNVVMSQIGPITKHFENWLNANGYGQYNFARHDLNNTGSYGGRHNESHQAKTVPIVFIHGNSDGALEIPGNYSSGSTYQIRHFELNGFTSAELYVTTWGNREADEASYQAHNCSMVYRQRAFVEAIMKYTGYSEVNLISHSFGVTLARKVVKGGMLYELYNNASCDIGPPLTQQIPVFIGISGANYGMCGCLATTYTCNPVNGFYPGDSCGKLMSSCGNHSIGCDEENYSYFLKEMNENPTREGRNVYVFWTRNDDIIWYGNYVWGRPSSRMPTQDREYVFDNFTHMQTKENTLGLQYELITNVTGFPKKVENNLSSQSLGFLLTVFLLAAVFE